MVDDLRGQEVKLDVRVCDVWPTADEPSALQVGCCSVTCGWDGGTLRHVWVFSYDECILC